MESTEESQSFSLKQITRAGRFARTSWPWSSCGDPAVVTHGRCIIRFLLRRRVAGDDQQQQSQVLDWNTHKVCCPVLPGLSDGLLLGPRGRTVQQVVYSESSTICSQWTHHSFLRCSTICAEVMNPRRS